MTVAGAELMSRGVSTVDTTDTSLPAVSTFVDCGVDTTDTIVIRGAFGLPSSTSLGCCALVAITELEVAIHGGLNNDESSAQFGSEFTLTVDKLVAATILALDD